MHHTASGSVIAPYLGVEQGELTSASAQWGFGLPDTRPRRGAGNGTTCRCHTALTPQETAAREEGRSETPFGPADPAQGQTGDMAESGEQKG